MNSSVVAVDDFNGDGRDDIIVADAWSWYEMYDARPDGSFDFSVWAPFADAVQTTLIATGDYDGNGLADLLMRTQTNSIIEVLSLGDENYALTDAARFDFPTPWHIQPSLNPFF